MQIASMENAFRRDNTDSSITKSENKTLKSALGENKNRMQDLEREVGYLEPCWCSSYQVLPLRSEPLSLNTKI